MTKLSTDELFHFTRFENLLNIIKHGFYPHYNLEHTLLSDWFKRPSVLVAIPMVCFCDIPLAVVAEHSSKYGRSAIGLDKKWGERHGLNPVIYVCKNSRLGDALSGIASGNSEYTASMIKDGSDKKIFEIFSIISTGIQELSYLVKQYERVEEEQYFMGDRLYTFKKGRFYDEREWRFVPPNADDDIWFINPSVLDNQEKLDQAHEKLKKHRLPFDLNDIKVIVTETEENKEKLIKAVAERFHESKKTIAEKIEFSIIADSGT